MEFKSVRNTSLAYMILHVYTLLHCREPPTTCLDHVGPPVALPQVHRSAEPPQPGSAMVLVSLLRDLDFKGRTIVEIDCFLFEAIPRPYQKTSEEAQG